MKDIVRYYDELEELAKKIFKDSDLFDSSNPNYIEFKKQKQLLDEKYGRYECSRCGKNVDNFCRWWEGERVCDDCLIDYMTEQEEKMEEQIKELQKQLETIESMRLAILDEAQKCVERDSNKIIELQKQLEEKDYKIKELEQRNNKNG